MGRVSRWLENCIEYAIDPKTVVVLFLLPGMINHLFIPDALHINSWGSLLNAEAFMFRWMEGGNSFRFAFLVSAFCGNYCLLFCWTPIFVCLRKWFRGQVELPRKYRRFRKFIDRSDWSLLVRGKDIGERIYYFLVPRRSGSLSQIGSDDYQSYFPLLYYGWMPGGEWTGICYMLEFRLYMLVAVPLLVVANTVKIFLFGGFSVLLADLFPALHRYPIPLIAGLVALPFVKPPWPRSPRPRHYRWGLTFNAYGRARISFTFATVTFRSAVLSR